MSSQRPNPVAAASRQTQTVLLVEDDVSVAQITTRWLRSLHFQVIVCAGGREACDLATARTEPIDLLLADVMLPGIRGPVLAEILRSSHPEMAVLFSSGYSPELLGEMFSAHLESALLLYKPYDAAQLASRVHLALARKAASRGAARDTGPANPPPASPPRITVGAAGRR